MKKVKKLTLNKETLRDLMAHNTGEVKGGGRSKHCNTRSCAMTCACPTSPFISCTCPGKTHNKPCLG